MTPHLRRVARLRLEVSRRTVSYFVNPQSFESHNYSAGEVLALRLRHALLYETLRERAIALNGFGVAEY